MSRKSSLMWGKIKWVKKTHFSARRKRRKQQRRSRQINRRRNK